MKTNRFPKSRPAPRSTRISGAGGRKRRVRGILRRMSTRSFAPLAVALALGACATAADVEKARASWQGATYEDVLRAWGARARSTTTTDGRYWYTWVTESYAQPSSSVGIGIGGMRIGGGGSTGVGVGMSTPVGQPEPAARCER